MNNEQLIEYFKSNAEYFVNNDIVLSVLRKIGWMIVKGLHTLTDLCITLYDKTFGLVDITTWGTLESLLESYNLLIKAIMVSSIVILGIMYGLGKNKKHNLITSILIFAAVVTSSNTVFSQLNLWTKTFKDEVAGTESTDGNELIRINLYDLIYIDDQIGLKSMTDDNRPQYENLSKEEIGYIDITEVLDPDDFDGDTKKILKKRMVFKAAEAGVLTDCYDGVAWTSWGNEFYYRYRFLFFTYFLDALATILVYICLSYKNTMISYELLFGRILATLFSANVSSQKRIRKILENIGDFYLALCFSALTLKGYFLFIEYVNEKVSNGILRGIISLFLAFCVIDGSKIMEKITGVDAGLSDMTGKLIAGMHLLQSVNQMRQNHNLQKLFGNGKEKGEDSERQNLPTGGQGIEQESNAKEDHQRMDEDLNQNSTRQNAGSEDAEFENRMQYAEEGTEEDTFENTQEMNQEQASDTEQTYEDTAQEADDSIENQPEGEEHEDFGNLPETEENESVGNRQETEEDRNFENPSEAKENAGFGNQSEAADGKTSAYDGPKNMFEKWQEKSDSKPTEDWQMSGRESDSMQQQQQEDRQNSYQDQNPYQEKGEDRKTEGTAKDRYGTAPEHTQKNNETLERKGKDKQS